MKDEVLGELSEDDLVKITAGIPNMTKEELEKVREAIKGMPMKVNDSKLDDNTLSNVIGGPIPREEAEEMFNKNVGKPR